MTAPAMITLHLTCGGVLERLAVPQGMPRNELVGAVQELFDTPEDAKLLFGTSQIPLAFCSWLPDDCQVDVVTNGARVWRHNMLKAETAWTSTVT
jgi:hypothetical protein